MAKKQNIFQGLKMCSHPNGKIADQEESDDLSTGLRSVLQWQWISFNFMADNDCDNI